MKKKTARLYFIDAIRAWAILMMLQGHFIDGLLDNSFRDDTNSTYLLWKYFRGITAPVFFTVSGFIFTYLLIRSPKEGFSNPRVKKGIKRGIELLCIGYLLRINFSGLLQGKLYDSFFLVDVLHCIGLSILGIILGYLLTYKLQKRLFPVLLLGITIVLFLFEPEYAKWTLSEVPDLFANYLTQINGSVFTIIPWLGYTTIGGFIAVLFTQYKEHKKLYPSAIVIAISSGLILILFSSDFFLAFSRLTGVQLFEAIYYNNYLFIRLGDVFLAFAVFMLLRQWLTNSTLLKLGQSTLSIYVIHFIILYGSFTGFGLYQFYNHSLSPTIVILGAFVFMVVCSIMALYYEKHKDSIKQRTTNVLKKMWSPLGSLIKTFYTKIKLF